MISVRSALLAFGLFASAAAPATAQIFPSPVPTDVVDVGAGATAVRYLLLHPPFVLNRPPSTIVVMLFAGGNGRLAITDQGAITTNLQGNFLVRMREAFARQNMYVAVVDTPGGVGINEATRLTPEYAQTMTNVIADLRTRTRAAKIWVVGTSSGTLSAASIAGLYYQQTIVPPVFPRPIPNSSRPNGVVLTATQTDTGSTSGTTCSGTIFDKPRLGSINVPVYVASDRSDRCPCSSPKRTTAIMDALTSTTVKQSQLFPLDGSASPPGTGTDACTAFTPHGFYNIEDSVVASISAYVQGH